MHAIRPLRRRLAGALLAACALLATQAPAASEDEAAISVLALLAAQDHEVPGVIGLLDDDWHAGYVPMLLEVMRLGGRPALSIAILELLEKRTGQSLGFDLHAWYEWLWSQPDPEHPAYAAFKSRLYRLIDPRFEEYFSSERESRIRLDEVVWGGVRQDGIPPLRGPKMLAAADADYLDDDNVVFGIAINGDARAYPKRILAWHEMFVDEIGGVPIAGVYCTLCGTVIPYVTEHAGVRHALGTSGFLFRSNKLMYDKATQSLWSTMWGEPVIGPLVGKGIKLAHRSVVTTTWGEWRRRHPDTQVLSLDTGHQRDYGEGAAYRDYFATDELMFNVPAVDRRLANKAEVLGLLPAARSEPPLAMAADFLAAHPVYHDRVGDLDFVVLTDASGANRVYQSEGVTFAGYDGDQAAQDEQGGAWTLAEDALTASDGRRLLRVPAYRAFWFGWYSAHSRTRLVRLAES